MKKNSNQVMDKNPQHHLAKGVMLGVVAPVVTVALLFKHYRQNKHKD